MNLTLTAEQNADRERPTCAIKLPSHVGTPATWADANHPQWYVCDRHRRQYEERADEFGPFAWEPI
jgi:hypothetical protein